MLPKLNFGQPKKVVLAKAEAYSDHRGNIIEYSESCDVKHITFRGSNNRMVIHRDARLVGLAVEFDCDGGYLEIGPCYVPTKGIIAHIRIGQSSRVVIGKDFTCTSRCMISAVEYSEVIIGEDCMIATENEIKTDDSHPIFDVRSGNRINMPRSIVIGNHVWLARRAVVLGGAEIGDGTVIGYNSVAKGRIPNNCVAVGSPARVIKKDTAWERPHLSLAPPYDKPNKASIPHSKYWNLTVDTPADDD